MNKLYKLILFFTASVFLSCGIESYVYLPQVSESNIIRMVNTDAQIYLPSTTNTYFRNYAIYYKIYTGINLLSNTPQTDYALFSTALSNDYNAIRPYTDPANASYSTGIDNLFKSRNYYQLSFVGKDNNAMMPMGGTLIIVFPTSAGSSPYAYLENNPNDIVFLNRSDSIYDPAPDRFFLNSNDLRTNDRNTDVARTGGTYVAASMYIVAVGYDDIEFKQVFSKPTHIHFFAFAGN